MIYQTPDQAPQSSSDLRVRGSAILTYEAQYPDFSYSDDETKKQKGPVTLLKGKEWHRLAEQATASVSPVEEQFYHKMLN